MNDDIPDKVSWCVVDAWLAIPPCCYSENPFCHPQCPYSYECFPLYEDDDFTI